MYSVHIILIYAAHIEKLACISHCVMNNNKDHKTDNVALLRIVFHTQCALMGYLSAF